MLTQRRRGKTQQQLLSLHKNGEDFQTSSRGVFESSIDNQIQNHLQVLRPLKYYIVNILNGFLDAIASLDLGYESQSVSLHKANNRYNSILNVLH